MVSKKTVLYDQHVALKAKMTDFAGYMMPIQYPKGIIAEHLATRKQAGLFDVSHMGRFTFAGKDALAFLQHTLTNNAAALEVGKSQYTIISDDRGFAVDDAYLYRFDKDQYILVVNASNKEKDWNHFQSYLSQFDDIQMSDITDELAMISLQGPASKEILLGLITSGSLPEPMRNNLSVVEIRETQVLLSRTGYTGEPICFELFIQSVDAGKIWGLLVENGAEPVGLGARDTLRLEAALPLYGHEFGTDPEGKEMPIYACPLARFAVSFSELKGCFVGREALEKQYEDFKEIRVGNYVSLNYLPRTVMPVALVDKGIARAGDKVFVDKKCVGYITSGTVVPYWNTEGTGLSMKLTDQHSTRAIALALIDSDILMGQNVEVEIRSKMIGAVVVPYHLRSEAPPYARPILHDKNIKTDVGKYKKNDAPSKLHTFLDKLVENTSWRQKECINLIPSEQTCSPLVRLASIMDPCGRYAEHKKIKALDDIEAFFYQGTDFIFEVEERLNEELRVYLGCKNIESRLISGQMANTVIFSAYKDYLNRLDRKSEPRSIRCVLNNHIIKGGHLSAQPMGALKDYIARNPNTEKPSVINFPVCKENPYQIDVTACEQLIAEHKPELIILGKSVILHPEPIREIRNLVEKYSAGSLIMYDMAHVLGLVGPHFQQPFQEGADVVSGSTHKTFFGPQRGIVAGNFDEEKPEFELWETVERRAFPGSVSNHHLGTLVGLLISAYEMNHFKDEYQKNVIGNAKVLAKALHENGLSVAGDPDVSFTQTHQVVIKVGYCRGPELASRLEDNNIIVNYQACPDEEGFTAAGALRLGVAEMTRFGMGPEDFKQLASYIKEVIVDNKDVKEEIKKFRLRFSSMKYCFSDDQLVPYIQKIHKLV